MSLISILIPVYNAAPFLEECMTSILAQSETNWELIVVDDFSTDESLSILKKYEAEDSRIRAFQNTSKGIIAALRLAYAHSNGNFITRMDADDIMYADKLKRLKDALTKKGKGYVATGFVTYFHTDGEIGDGYKKYEDWLNHLTATASNFSEIYKECVIPSPCWLVYREDLEKCGTFKPNTYPEDYDLCFRFYENGLKVVGVKELLHHWRDHSDRTSRNSPTYANNQYLSLKVPYFVNLDYQANRPLVLWGAGKKGKTIAKILAAKGVTFHWICNTSNKWGIKLHTVTLAAPRLIDELKNPQIIVAVASPDGQTEILEKLNEQKLKKGEDYFFFC